MDETDKPSENFDGAPLPFTPYLAEGCGVGAYVRGCDERIDYHIISYLAARRFTCCGARRDGRWIGPYTRTNDATQRYVRSLNL